MRTKQRAKIEWSTEVRELGILKPWTKNPNKMSESEFKRLGLSLQRFGYVSEIVINRDDMIIGGWHRYKQLLAAHGEEYLTEVRVPDRLLVETEVNELGLMLNQTGNIDKDVLLKNFRESELIERGIYRKEEIKAMDGGFKELGGSKPEIVKDASMRTVTLDMLPEDYETLLDRLEGVEIAYIAKSEKLRLGLKLGVLIRGLE